VRLETEFVRSHLPLPPHPPLFDALRSCRLLSATPPPVCNMCTTKNKDKGFHLTGALQHIFVPQVLCIDFSEFITYIYILYIYVYI